MKKIYEYELSGTDRDVSSSFMKKKIMTKHFMKRLLGSDLSLFV